MRPTTLVPTIAAACLAAGTAAADTGSAPVYLIASLTVTDMEAYMADYAMPVTPMLLEAGGEILVGALQVDVLEGAYASNWTVVVRFPSETAARAWYESEEYQTLVPMRRDLTEAEASTMLLAPQFVAPPAP